MDFYAVLDEVLELLQRHKRVTYRALKRQFGLDDAYLEDLKAEIIEARQLAVDQGGTMLVWCGDLAAPPPPAVAPVSLPNPTPLAYTPKHLAEKILTSRSTLEGERKQVTVLFADVAGFTTLAEQLDPEVVHDLINHCFEGITAEVHRFEGTINQYTGDGVMALFGAPIAHEDSPRRAVHAALGIQRAIRDVAQALQAERGLTLQMRIGINTGLVVVGKIGDDLRMDYTAVGDTTNLAARLQQMAQPGSVVISATTHQHIAGFFETRDLGEVPVKGRAPVRVFEVLRPRGRRTRFDVAVERGLTPLVGREQELATLRERFREVKAGRGQVVSIAGEAGIGKSRLVLEFRRALAQAGEAMTWLEGHCISFGQASPFLPLIEQLRENFQIDELDGEPEIIAKVEQGMRRMGELEAYIPAIRYLLSVDPGDAAFAVMDGPARRRQLFAALRALSLRGAQLRPLALVAELAHHFTQGGVWDKALAYCRQAGEKAMARSAYREAVTSFEQALAALAQLPERRDTIEQAIDLRCDLRNALFPLSEFGRIEGYLREAEALTGSLDDPRRLGWVSAFMSGHLMATGGHAMDVRTFAQRVQDVGETLGDVPLQVAAQYYLVHAGHLSGDYRGTEHLCRRLMQSLQGERARERFGLAIFPAVLSRAYLTRSLAEQGAFDEADTHGHEAIQIAEALDHPFSIVNACLGLAYLDGVRGELSQAARLLERAVALCRDWDITFWTPIGLASLGHVYTWSGRIREGVSWLQQALTTYESAGFGLFHSLSVVQLGEAYLLADQVEAARACAERAVRLARERGERGYEAWSLRLLGDIASYQDRPDVATAEAHYSTATALASELGMRPLQVHCHFGLRILYNRIGRPEQARTELSAAIALYRAMEMTFWLERAEIALAQGRERGK